MQLLRKLMKERRIPSLDKYRLTKAGHLVLDRINPKRIFIALSIVASIIIWYGVSQEEKIRQEHQHLSSSLTQHTSPKRTAVRGYIIKSNKSVSPSESELYANLIFKYAAEMKIDPYVLAGLIRVESSFDRYAMSKAGALGLTQVIPAWHPEKIRIVAKKFGHCDVFNPEHNIMLGALVLKEYTANHKGNIPAALLQYNGSLHHDNPTYYNAVIRERNKLRNGSKTT